MKSGSSEPSRLFFDPPSTTLLSASAVMCECIPYKGHDFQSLKVFCVDHHLFLLLGPKLVTFQSACAVSLYASAILPKPDCCFSSSLLPAMTLRDVSFDPLDLCYLERSRSHPSNVSTLFLRCFPGPCGLLCCFM